MLNYNKSQWEKLAQFTSLTLSWEFSRCSRVFLCYYKL